MGDGCSVSRLTTALILFFGVQAAIAGTLTIGELIAFVLIANQVTQPILRTAQLWQDFQEAQVSIEHLGENDRMIIFTTEAQRHGEK